MANNNSIIHSLYYKDVAPLEQTLGLTFNDKNLLTQALVHRSFLNENRDFPLGHNERLEFLGDAVLELVVTDYLYRHYDNPEGELTNWRASLVNSQMLAALTSELQLEDNLYLSRGEQRDRTGKARAKILANVFESLIGAIYLEHGYQAAEKFINDRLLVKLADILKHKLYLDPKTYFQEAAQERLSITPTYEVVHEVGPDHSKNFTVAVFLNSEKVTEGTGTSKQEAQVNAARAAIKLKGW
ncbi:MAG: ribonuclease III [Candidatus Kerfeldbacteria bacterium]|nr:ribonuclease III [Candidatus Kerfeldbacteria bacterium]